MTPLDPVTLAVLNGRLVQIADEMDATLYRSAFNPIIAEAHDACHGLYHAETGATLVQGTSGLPIFVGAMAFAVRAVIDKVARDGELKPFSGDTDIFIFPGRPFHVVDALVTNFHLPESTLLMLVSALMGSEKIREIYGHAVERGYRFFSYGDASLLLPEESC